MGDAWGTRQEGKRANRQCNECDQTENATHGFSDEEFRACRLAWRERSTALETNASLPSSHLAFDRCRCAHRTMSEQEKKPEQAAEEEQGGVLLACGATDWYSIGRTKEVRPEYPNLSVPHRLKALEVKCRRRRSFTSP